MQFSGHILQMLLDYSRKYPLRQVPHKFEILRFISVQLVHSRSEMQVKQLEGHSIHESLD